MTGKDGIASSPMAPRNDGQGRDCFVTGDFRNDGIQCSQ